MHVIGGKGSRELRAAVATLLLAGIAAVDVLCHCALACLCYSAG